MLGMELKARGHRATYLMSYLAEGEAPDEARNVFQQRSRWTKGHYQVGGAKTGLAHKLRVYEVMGFVSIYEAHAL
jgi:cellulose synthase/poly-beta-1,6-N-acetylglucosamine synthase-like glycosyltransferase